MNTSVRSSLPLLLRSTLALSLVFLAGRALAQEAVKPLEDTAKPASDDVVQLDTFKVSATIDTYHQQSSSMASKVPMDLKELPSSLSIMNSTAITDRNAVVLTDVFNYVVGATQSQGNINGFSFRGFPNTGSYTQNIQFDGLMGATLKKAGSSAANVDSLEFLKGPNGVLYGQMNPGGLLNIVTKNPKERQETYLRLTAGFYAGEFTSFGSKITNTFSIDTTGPVFGSKHLFYRLVTDAGSTPSSRPGNWDRNYSVYPSLTYKWSKDTSFTVKMESSQDVRRQDDGVIPIFTSTPVSITQAGVVTSTAAFGENAAYYTAPLNTVYNDHKDGARDYGQAISTVFHTNLGSEWQLRVQSRSVWHVDIVREFTVNNANVFSPTAKYATPTSAPPPAIQQREERSPLQFRRRERLPFLFHRQKLQAHRDSRRRRWRRRVLQPAHCLRPEPDGGTGPHPDQPEHRLRPGLSRRRHGRHQPGHESDGLRPVCFRPDEDRRQAARLGRRPPRPPARPWPWIS